MLVLSEVSQFLVALGLLAHPERGQNEEKLDGFLLCVCCLPDLEVFNSILHSLQLRSEPQPVPS